MNDKGKILADQYDSYIFLEQSDLALVLKYDGHNTKYGAVNTKGELVIPLKYGSKEELCEAEGIHNSQVMDEENTVNEKGDLEIVGETGNQGVIRKDGTVVLPLKYINVSITDTKPTYLCAGQSAVHNQNEITLDNALFDQKWLDSGK